METPSMTVHQVEAQIADARERLAILDREAQDLAMPTVSGDPDAAASLARINSEVTQITADLAVLDRARLTAAQQQREADEARKAADRSLRMADARASAAHLIELARDIDRAQRSMLPMLNQLVANERAIWNSLRQADAPPTGMIVGQRDLAGLAMDRLISAAQGRTMFLSDQRCVEEIAAAAWSFLLTTEQDEAADD